MSEWRETTLRDISLVVKRGKAPLYADNGLLVLNQKCVRAENRVDLSFARRTDADKRPVNDWALLTDSDVLVNSTGRGTLGRASLAPRINEPVTVDSHVAIVRVDQDKATPEFVALNLSARQADLESFQSGSTNQTELSAKTLAAIPVLLPPISEQRRIANLMAAVDGHLVALSDEVDKLRVTFARRKDEVYGDFTREGTPCRLGSVLAEIKRPIVVDPTVSYRQIGVRSHGRGIFTKEPVTGEELGSKKVFWVEPGDLVINIVFAWEGAVALMPDGLEGYCGSHRFPTYRRIDDGEIDFFRYYFTTTDGVALLGNCSPGGAGRNRTLNRKRLMETTVFLPDLAAQQMAVAELRALEAAVDDLEAELARFRTYRSALLTGLLSQEIEIPESYDAFLDAVS
ncbi:restriction endonuclease subunit S [Haloechinothrix salitolerans]|uniref:Restriction endonuclease subunit S n=1 Tax=Haloechinothrix salitolerans TaxID=926830 RepID=A0ABW2C0P6_9PSEU